MQMEAVKAALQDLLSAMDAEDKRVLKEKLSGAGSDMVDTDVAEEKGEMPEEGEPADSPFPPKKVDDEDEDGE